MRTRFGIGALLVTVLSGCASTLTGYESESKLKCAVSEGVACTPVSKVYAMAQAGTLPSQLARSQAQPSELTHNSKGPTVGSMRPFMGSPLSSGMPLRSEARVLRIWIAPWQDDTGSLRDQQYVYVTLDRGRWMIEHNQAAIIDQYRPTTLRQGPAQDPAPVKGETSQSRSGNQLNSNQ